MDKKLQEIKNQKHKEHKIRLESIIRDNSFKSVDSLQPFFKNAEKEIKEEKD